MSLEGRIENGHVVFDVPVTLPEGTPVRVEPLSNQPESLKENNTDLLEVLKNVVGAIQDLPSDLATHHDHYLYGTPKK